MDVLPAERSTHQETKKAHNERSLSHVLSDGGHLGGEMNTNPTYERLIAMLDKPECNHREAFLK